MTGNIVAFAAIAYTILLFSLAFLSDKWARQGKGRFLKSPLIYTLAISVYCTSWTFYGSVGSAANNGLEFLAVFLGPTLIFIGWWYGLRKLVRISHAHRITSVADLISSRFSKSGTIAVVVTLMAVIATTPYIALQLKAITTSLRVMTQSDTQSLLATIDEPTLAFIIAALMALFTILFGTRNVDANEQHHGVVAAIAFEAVVKLTAIFAVGLFVVFGLGGGLGPTFARAAEAGVQFTEEGAFGNRWMTINFLAAAAVICLPRQFQITVVENANEDHLRTASWAFPLYLIGMSVFTIPIAIMGKSLLPAGADPDMFVLTVPLLADQQALALFAFIGGFSSATSMIIVSSIALSIMVSNHIVVPIVLRSNDFESQGANAGGVTNLLLSSRRISIAVVLFLGFGYFWLTNGSGALAIIGLISFAGVAQFLPAIIAALFWKDATRIGALAGLLTGFAIWLYTHFLPAFASANPAVADLVLNGPWNIAVLKPQSLFGMTGMDPLVHAVMWSMLGNILALIGVSIATENGPMGRLQATRFVDIFRNASLTQTSFAHASVKMNDLFRVAQRVVGYERAQQIFDSHLDQKDRHHTTEPTAEFISKLESELAGTVGAASAHVMLGQVVSGDDDAIEEIIRMADETQQIIEYSQKLEITTSELQSTAQQLRLANAQLRQLDRQKDEFLSQVSHEVRTPMTAVRSFSEILLSHDDISAEQRQQFLSTIHKESMRLTSLLDEILDLSALERGEKLWSNSRVNVRETLEQAIKVCTPIAAEQNLEIQCSDFPQEVLVEANADRLSQVFINLITNAAKYNDNEAPQIVIRGQSSSGQIKIQFSDNGPGISQSESEAIFEKFSRGRATSELDQSGSGLGLAISREIITRCNGTLELVDHSKSGACFEITLPTLT